MYTNNLLYTGGKEYICFDLTTKVLKHNIESSMKALYTSLPLLHNLEVLFHDGYSKQTCTLFHQVFSTIITINVSLTLKHGSL